MACFEATNMKKLHKDRQSEWVVNYNQFVYKTFLFVQMDIVINKTYKCIESCNDLVRWAAGWRVVWGSSRRYVGCGVGGWVLTSRWRTSGSEGSWEGRRGRLRLTVSLVAVNVTARCLVLNTWHRHYTTSYRRNLLSIDLWFIFQTFSYSNCKKELFVLK